MLRVCWSLGLLLVAFVASPTHGQTSPAPEWTVERSTYQMDDTPILSLTLRSVPVAGAPKSVLTVRCKQRELQIYVAANELKGSEIVRIRFDSRPYTTETWEYSTDYHALFSPSPKLLLKELLRSKDLLFESSKFVGKDSIVRFRLAPLAKHLPEIAEKCSEEQMQEQFQKELGTVTWYQVREVVTGELLVLSDGSSVALQCLSTPPSSMPMHFAAKLALKTLIGNSRVRLEYDEEILTLGRAYLAYVFLEDGREVNVELVRMGFASVLPLHGCSRFGEFHTVYLEAKGEGRGMWAKPPGNP